VFLLRLIPTTDSLCRQIRNSPGVPRLDLATLTVSASRSTTGQHHWPEGCAPMLRTMLFRPILEFSRSTPNSSYLSGSWSSSGWLGSRPWLSPLMGRQPIPCLVVTSLPICLYVSDDRVSPFISASGTSCRGGRQRCGVPGGGSPVSMRRSSSSYADTVFASSAFAFLPPPAPKRCRLLPTEHVTCSDRR
jgi:hypothetical protein